MIVGKFTLFLIVIILRQESGQNPQKASDHTLLKSISGTSGIITIYLQAWAAIIDIKK